MQTNEIRLPITMKIKSYLLNWLHENLHYHICLYKTRKNWDFKFSEKKTDIAIQEFLLLWKKGIKKRKRWWNPEKSTKMKKIKK